MAHIHSIYDTDPHFAVNAKTRALTNKSESKIVLVQYDHNSERVTFELPRLIDGHDMSLCNVVRVHYCNIDAATKKAHKDVYEVEDLQLSPEDDNVVICSWLISRNATQLVGALSFVLEFSCVVDGVVEYAWHTAVSACLNITTGMSNGEQVVSDYADVLQQWRDELFGAGGGSSGGGGTGSGADGFSPVANVQQTAKGVEISITDKTGTTKATVNHGQDGVGIANIYQKTTSLDDGGENIFVVELTNGSISNFTVRNGKKGQDGKTPVKGTDYFDGQDGKDGQDAALYLTESEFDALTAEEITTYYNAGIRLVFVEDDYENLVPKAISESGTVYNGCGYLIDYRLNSAGEVVSMDSSVLTGFMPHTPGGKLRIFGGLNNASEGGQYIATYDSNFELIAANTVSLMLNNAGITEYTAENVRIYTIDTAALAAFDNAAYVRVCLRPCIGRQLKIGYLKEGDV